MSDICFVEDMILARVSDPATGLNYWNSQFAAQFGISVPADYTINFNLATTAQVINGEVDAKDIEKTSAVKYPQFHYWVKAAQDLQENKGTQFSGNVIAQIRILLSWRAGSALKVKYDQLGKCFIAAMGSTFDRHLYAGWSQPAIAQPFSFVRSPVTTGGEYWSQGILYTMPFIVEA